MDDFAHFRRASSRRSDAVKHSASMDLSRSRAWKCCRLRSRLERRRYLCWIWTFWSIRFELESFFDSITPNIRAPAFRKLYYFPLFEICRKKKTTTKSRSKRASRKNSSPPKCRSRCPATPDTWHSRRCPRNSSDNTHISPDRRHAICVRRRRICHLPHALNLVGFTLIPCIWFDFGKKFY